MTIILYGVGAGKPAAAPGRQARVLRILRWLQAGHGPGVEELAGQLQVGRRTILRDMNVIRAAGFPVRFDRRLRGYQLGASPALQPDLDDDDLVTLLLAAQLSVLQGIPELAVALADIRDKLLGRHAHHVRHAIQRLAMACSVWTPDQQDRHWPTLRLLFEAVRRRRRLLLTFGQADGLKTRTRFAPYRIELAFDQWLVRGHCSHDQRVRDLDVSRIEARRLSQESYHVPSQYQRQGCTGV